MNSAIATFPKFGYDAPFAPLTAEMDELLRRLTPAAQAVWREFRRSHPPGIDFEFNSNKLAQTLNYSTRWIRHALKELLELGLLESDRKSWREWFSVRVIDLGILHKTSNFWKSSGKKQPSNADSLVTSRLENLKNEQTGEFSLENSAEQKEGLRSPLPKPKPRNQEPELEPEPEITEALALIAEYGTRTGNQGIENNFRVKNAITKIAPNLSPEKLIERVRNAIAATEQTRLKGALQKPIECLLSVAIARGMTFNPPKAEAAVTGEQPLENGAGRVYCAADWELPLDEVGRLINPPAATNEAPSEKNREFSEGNRCSVCPDECPDKINSEFSEGNRQLMSDRSDNSSEINPEFSDRNSETTLECQVIHSEKEPPIQSSQLPTPNHAPSEPTDVSDPIALSRSYERDLGITPGDRVATIQELIGVSVSHPSRLAEPQLLEYVRKLKELADKVWRRSQ